jgi:hypothetical protein
LRKLRGYFLSYSFGFSEACRNPRNILADKCEDICGKSARFLQELTALLPMAISAVRYLDLAVHRVFQSGQFSPEDLAVLGAVLDDALRQLRLVDRDDPVVSLVADRIVALARQQEPRLLEAVLKSFVAP